MKNRIFAFFISAFAFGLSMPCAFAQDSLVSKIALANVHAFLPENDSFTGAGWQKIMKEVKNANNVLIGEDHFTNEIPYFTSAIAAQAKFENFFCEIDPYTAELLERKIKSLSEADLQRYIDTFGNTFSFYAFAPEFRLLRQLTRSNTKIRGTDQILLVGDRVLFHELSAVSANSAAKAIYRAMEDSSRIYFDRFLLDQRKPFYLLTAEFDKKISDLLQLPLNGREKQVIKAMKLSAKIYKSQDHELRIQLMKNQLMGSYGQWSGKKNLFKYGANHVAKGESLMEIFDIGNLVSNIDDSNFKSSLHIMVLGAGGSHASPFEGHPDQAIDESSSLLKAISPLTKVLNREQWQCFDLRPIKKALAGGKLKVDDLKLSRVIKGYDLLVVIPKATAARSAKTNR